MRNDMTEYDQLEGLVDRRGAADVLSWLAQICSDKAEHLRSNSEDESLAETWEEISEQIENLSSNCEV